MHPDDNTIARSVEFLFEACAFAGASAQEVQAGAADFAVAFDNYFVDAGAAQQEGTFNANTIGSNTADGECGIVAAIVHVEDNPFEFLDAFAIAFLDLHMHADRIAAAEFGNVRIYWRFICFN